MKIKPEIYARTLIEAVFSNQRNQSNIIRSFWFSLHRNGQYRDLNKIIDKIDQEYAKIEDAIFARVYSSSALSENEISQIKQSVSRKYNQKVILENIVKKNLISGVVVKIDDREIDLSIANKIERLKQKLKEESK